MDPVTTSIVILLGRYALDKGVELGKEIGPKALDTVKEMFALALDRVRRRPAGEVIAEEFEADPETYEKPLEKELDAAMAADAEFAAQLKALLERVDALAARQAEGSGTSYRATLRGSGALAQGPGAAAASGRGVVVTGDVAGAITTGDHTTVAERRRGQERRDAEDAE